MDSIFHEKQEGQLCAQHCINNLLQGAFFNAVDLAKIATELDEAERTTMIEGMDAHSLETVMKQPSSNMDDSGFFSVQVINKALTVWSLSMVPLSSPSMKEAMEHPTSCQAFICHQDQHWFTIRKLGKQWFNLDSMKRRPELVSDTYLRLFLAQLQLEGYTIFVIEGSLPSCEADQLLSLITVQSAAPTPSTSKVSFADALTKFFKGLPKEAPQGGQRKNKEEEEEYQLELASALSASMNPGDTRDSEDHLVGVISQSGGVDKVYEEEECRERYEVEITAALHASLEDQLETENLTASEQKEEADDLQPPQGSEDSCGEPVEDTDEQQAVDLKELREKRLQHFT